MHFQYPLLALAGLAAAAPTAQPSNANEEASFLSNVQLEVDDVILMGVDGRFEVVKETEFVELTKAANITIGAEKADKTLSLDQALEIGKRQNCAGLNSEFVINRREEFLDWDVQISPVIGTQQGTAIATIARGYQVANGISVSAEVGIKGEVFSAALGIELSKTWTTIDTTTISYNVPMGVFGVIVSQPWTLRHHGDVFTSCTTDNWRRTPFTADSHTSQTFGNLNWVRGVFRLCSSTQYPIPFCAGSGFHR